MIEIALNDVSIDFGFKKVLKGVSFDIQTGEKVAIVGGNGSGKTTILKVITGREKCDGGMVSIRKGATIGYLAQDSYGGCEGVSAEEFLKDAQRPVFEIEKKLRELERRMSDQAESAALDKLLAEYGRMQNAFIAMSGYETDENFNKICGAFKIGEAELAQNFTELSGGRKTIVGLAKVLLQVPDILLLDEPTNHIDIGTLRWLEGFIREYRGTVVVVSHDRYFIDETAGKTILIDQGIAEVYNGNYSFCLEEQERQTLLEFERYKNQRKMIEAMKEAIKRFREWGAIGNNQRLFRKAASMEKRLERMEVIDKPQEREKPPLGFTAGSRSGKRVLTVGGLDFSYNSSCEGRVLFENAAMEIFYKDKVCLLGDNGMGKSTLVRLIMNQMPCEAGVITLGESARIGYIEQEIIFKDENETVLSAFRGDAIIGESDARRILAKYFFCGDDVYKRLRSLSGGEKVLFRLALLMLRDVNFLILDEPTNHLDIDTKELLEQSLADYKGTLLFISHDRYFINKIATRIVSIEDRGLVCYEGNYEYYLEKRR